ncbi:hypothetical protein N0V82_005710 [Gnomoniopsis sp. IMI 355080]|nr:hypothetical protein N0V82_005710 [Gnomoniopsis sp. IMI 355080]
MTDPAVPSFDEIRASTEILSPPRAVSTVVKVGQFVVKFGPQVTLQEAESQQFVSENSNVPVPKIIATMKEPDTGYLFIVMEYVDGKELGEAWKLLTPMEKLDVGKQLQDAFEDLRKIPNPGYFGGLNRKPLPDGVFSDGDPEENLDTCGPFETEEELNEAIIKRIQATQPATYVALVRRLISDTLRGHRAVFTHGDLQPKNILVSRVGDKDDGSGKFKISIIDWENSGWYPDYWEFCNSSIWEGSRPDWLELIQQIMPIPTLELLMLRKIRSNLFW